MVRALATSCRPCLLYHRASTLYSTWCSQIQNPETRPPSLQNLCERPRDIRTQNPESGIRKPDPSSLHATRVHGSPATSLQGTSEPRSQIPETGTQARTRENTSEDSWSGIWILNSGFHTCWRGPCNNYQNPESKNPKFSESIWILGGAIHATSRCVCVLQLYGYTTKSQPRTGHTRTNHETNTRTQTRRRTPAQANQPTNQPHTHIRNQPTTPVTHTLSARARRPAGSAACASSTDSSARASVSPLRPGYILSVLGRWSYGIVC